MPWSPITILGSFSKNSFSDILHLKIDKKSFFDGTFIRAPKVDRIGKNIKILASYNNYPVLITDGHHYASSFHPEIGNDHRIYNYFLERINA